jgi:hypothetical protein
VDSLLSAGVSCWVFLPCLDPHLFSVSLISFSCFPPFFIFPACPFFKWRRTNEKLILL